MTVDMLLENDAQLEAPEIQFRKKEWYLKLVIEWCWFCARSGGQKIMVSTDFLPKQKNKLVCTTIDIHDIRMPSSC